MSGKAVDYVLDVEKDVYDSVIYPTEFYIIDYLKMNVVHCDNVYEYFCEWYQDLFIQMLDEDHELYEYITNTYDCGVYKR